MHAVWIVLIFPHIRYFDTLITPLCSYIRLYHLDYRMLTILYEKKASIMASVNDTDVCVLVLIQEKQHWLAD